MARDAAVSSRLEAKTMGRACEYAHESAFWSSLRSVDACYSAQTKGQPRIVSRCRQLFFSFRRLTCRSWLSAVANRRGGFRKWQQGCFPKRASVAQVFSSASPPAYICALLRSKASSASFSHSTTIFLRPPARLLPQCYWQFYHCLSLFVTL